MNLVKRYYFYKRMLLVLFFLNIFLVSAGVGLLLEYYSHQTPPPSNIIIISVLTLIFGVILPSVLLNRLTQTMKSLKTQTEAIVAHWVSKWLESYQSKDERAVKDPYFWLNISLLTVEVLGDHVKSPVLRYLSEFSPVIRQEIAKKDQPKRTKKVA